MSSVTFLASVDAHGKFVCEIDKGLGVDVDAARFAPADKSVRAHVHFDSSNPALLEAFLGLLGCCEPGTVAGVPMPIGKDAPK